MSLIHERREYREHTYLRGQMSSWLRTPTLSHAKVTDSRAQIPSMKATRLVCRLPANPQTPLSRRDATGAMTSASGPTSRREMVLKKDRRRTCWAALAVADDPAEGSERTMDPRLEITISAC